MTANYQAYQHTKQQIDQALEQLDGLLRSQKTYFSAQQLLQARLCNLDDPRYLSRIAQAPDSPAQKLYHVVLQNKALIEQTVASIDSFQQQSIELLQEIFHRGVMEKQDLEAMFFYLHTLVVDNNSQEKIPMELIDFFAVNTLEKCNLSQMELAILLHLLIQIKAKTRFSFAYPHWADMLVQIAESSTDIPLQGRAGFLLEAGDYYVVACQRAKAMQCYHRVAELYRKADDLQNSAYALQKYYKINNSFPANMQVEADQQQLQQQYGKFAKIVLQGVESKVLKVDPVEFSDGFAEIFQQVMHKVEKEIDKVGDLHLVHQRWQLMAKYFEQAGICWRTPGVMNPGVRFD